MVCLLFFFAISASAFSGTPVSKKKFPNIILIVSDNQSAELLGTYGNEEVKTPNIDSLASNGVKFNNAIAVNGVCSPTRATLLTGLIPSQTGVHVALPKSERIKIKDWDAIEEFRSLPQTLSEAGYNTALIGKYHLGTHDTPRIGFQHWITFLSGHTTKFHDVPVIDNGKRYRVQEHLTDFWTNKALDYLDAQKEDKPFFLYLSYNGPYMLPPAVNAKPRNRHASFYEKNPPSMPQEKVHPYLKNWAKGIRGPSKFMVDEGTTAWAAIEALNNQTAMINAASETTMVDDGVGAVMEKLEQLGIAEDTIIIYTSDQGASYGHHGLWGNTSWSFPFTAYGINMHVPLIFHHKGSMPAGAEWDNMIGQYDFFPTLLDYIGMGDIEVENSPGRRFTSLLKGNEIKEWDDAVFFEFVTVRMVRTKKWAYMKRFDTEEPDALYDLVNDPQEIVNLIDKPEYQNLIKRLDNRLTKFFAENNDPQYDLWNGGTAKAILLDVYYGRNDIFRNKFENWKEPAIKKARKIFTDKH